MASSALFNPESCWGSHLGQALPQELHLGEKKYLLPHWARVHEHTVVVELTKHSIYIAAHAHRETASMFHHIIFISIYVEKPVKLIEVKPMGQHPHKSATSKYGWALGLCSNNCELLGIMMQCISYLKSLYCLYLFWRNLPLNNAKLFPHSLGDPTSKVIIWVVYINCVH